MKRQIAWIGVLIGVLALGIGYGYYRAEGPDSRIWQTMTFTTLAFAQIGQALGSRSSEASFFALGLRTNPTLLVMVLATFLLQLAAIYAPFLDAFFQVVPLKIEDLLVAMGLGLFVFIVIELEKQLQRGRQGER